MRNIVWCTVPLIGLWLGPLSLAQAEPPKRTHPVELCVTAGQTMTVDVRFDAAYQNVLELRVGDRVLRRFDNKYEHGADADQGGGTWQLPAFAEPTCITVTSYHRPNGHSAWTQNRYHQRADGIGFEDSVDGDFNDAEIIFDTKIPLS